MSGAKLFDAIQPVLNKVQPYLQAIPPLLQKGYDFANKFVDTSRVAQGVAAVAQKVFGYSSYLGQESSTFLFNAIQIPLSGYGAWKTIKEVSFPFRKKVETLFDMASSFGQIGIFCNEGLHLLQKIEIQTIFFISIKPCLIAFGTLSFLGRFTANILEISYAKTVDEGIASRLSLVATALDLIGVAVLSLTTLTPVGYTFLTISVIVTISRSAYNPPDKPNFSRDKV